jgi:hypothetical protein
LSPACFAAALLLASCNEPSHDKAAARAAAPAAAAAPAGNPSPCALVPQADMSAAIGKPVVRQEEPQPGRCISYTDDPLVYVDLSVDRTSAAESWKGTNAGNELIGASQSEVVGLGDKAVFGPRDRLYVLRGHTFLAIEAGFDADVRARAGKVAALVLSKLP